MNGQQTKSTNIIKRWHCIVVSIILVLFLLFKDVIYLHGNYFLTSPNPNLSTPTTTNNIVTVNKQTKNKHNSKSSNLSSIPIYGEKRYCNSKQKTKFQYKYKSAVIMGMYNTGTNALLNLLQHNCYGLKTNSWIYKKEFITQKRFKNTVPFSVKYFDKFTYNSRYNITKHQALPSSANIIHLGIDYDKDFSFTHNELYIVIIRDPLTWFKSMCKSAYYVQFARSKWYRHCPINISEDNGTASVNLWHGRVYLSLIDLFNKFYESWMDSNTTVGLDTNKRSLLYQLFYLLRKNKKTILTTNYNVKYIAEQQLQDDIDIEIDSDPYNKLNISQLTQNELIRKIQAVMEPIKVPHVIVRFEDLLFQPKRLLNRLCKCVDGYVHKGDIILLNEAAKNHGKSTNRTQALRIYSNPKYRYYNYTTKDLQFINSELNHTISKYFGYEVFDFNH